MATKITSFPLSLLLFLVTAFATIASSSLAGVRTHADYIAIDVEGEDNVSKDVRWVLTEPTTPAQDQDPDGNHSDTAVGNSYLELLPDVRVTHSDPFGPPTAIWGAAGTGPELNFTVYFPESGRYYVHVRALSTGSEDNGIHVGLNDNWPSHGERIQWCTNGRGWQWSSRQRDSGGAGPCGASHTVWIEVPSAGTHSVDFSAREDGFEFDRFMLIKDLSDNTRICQPYSENDISCQNGSIESNDDVVDMGITFEADLDAVKIGEDVNFTMIVINEDNYDTANNVEVNIAADVGEAWEMVSLDEHCQGAGTDINCVLGSIVPSNPDERDHRYSIILRALTAGNSSVDAVVSTTDIDGNAANDDASTSVTIEDSIPWTTLTAELSGDLSSRKVNEAFSASLELTNTGADPAFGVYASVVVPTGLVLDDKPDNCIGTTVIQCDFGDLEAGESATINLAMTAVAEGLNNLSITSTATNLSTEPAVIQRSLLILTESVAPLDTNGGASGWLLLTSLSALIFTRRSLQTGKETFAEF